MRSREKESVLRREKIVFSDQSISVRRSNHAERTPLFNTTESTRKPSWVQKSLQIPKGVVLHHLIVEGMKSLHFNIVLIAKILCFITGTSP